MSEVKYGHMNKFATTATRWDTSPGFVGLAKKPISNTKCSIYTPPNTSIYQASTDNMVQGPLAAPYRNHYCWAGTYHWHSCQWLMWYIYLGADISVVGLQLLQLLKERPLNLLLSEIVSCTADDHSMQPMGKIPVTLHFTSRDNSIRKACAFTHNYQEWLYLGRLQEASVPAFTVSQPILIFALSVSPDSGIKAINIASRNAEVIAIINKYPTAFNGQIKIKQDEELRICLAPNTLLYTHSMHYTTC